MPGSLVPGPFQGRGYPCPDQREGQEGVLLFQDLSGVPPPPARTRTEVLPSLLPALLAMGSI